MFFEKFTVPNIKNVFVIQFNSKKNYGKLENYA